MEAQILHYENSTLRLKNPRKIKVGCYSGTTGLSHDEYITIENNNVVWSSGARIIKSFQLTPSITPNTDIPMTLRSATTMNVDTPVNYFRDTRNSLNIHKYNNNNIYDKLPFVDDNIFDIPTMQSSLHEIYNKRNQTNHNNNNNNILRENNENVNTDNCYPERSLPISLPNNNNTDNRNADTDSDNAMSLEDDDEPQQTPPAMIKPDRVLCDDKCMDIDSNICIQLDRKPSFSGLSQDLHGINIKTPTKKHAQPISVQLKDDNKQEKESIDVIDANDDLSRVIDVIWCYFPHFPSNEPQRCLCLLQNEIITVVSSSGDIYYIPLPCEMQSIWSLPEGLMIQAKIPKNLKNYHHDDYPILFSLLNPLEELRPISLHLLNVQSKSLFFDQYYHKVALKFKAQSSSDSDTNNNNLSTNKRNKTCFESPKKRMLKFGHKAQLSASTILTPKNDKNQYLDNGQSVSFNHGDFFENSNEIVIFSSLTQPIIVTFNTQSYYHTIWVIRHDKKEINKRLNTNEHSNNHNNHNHNSHKTKVSMIEDETLLHLSDSDEDNKMLHHSLLHTANDENQLNHNQQQDTSTHMNQTSISSIRELLAGDGHNNSRQRNKKKWTMHKKDSPNPFNISGVTNEHFPSPINPIHNVNTPTPKASMATFKGSTNLYPHTNNASIAIHDSDSEDEERIFSELFVECCWKEKIGVLYNKVKSIYGATLANSIDFNEKATVFFACDIYNDPLICIFRSKSKLIASYRLKCKSLDETFSGRCGVGVNEMISSNGSTSLNIELLFVWMGINDIKPIRSLRSLSHCDDDDYHYYQFYSLHQNNNGINKGANSMNNENNTDFESLLNGNGNGCQTQSLLQQMQEMSSFDYDLLVLNGFTKTLSIYSANYKLCDIVLPNCLNISMIKSLQHAVNNRITLNCVHNQQYRIIIPRWDKNIRVIAILKCFQLFLTPDLMHCIRILLIELHSVNKGSLWYELCQIILYFIMITGPYKNNNIHSKSSKASKLISKKNKQSAWQRLQQSDFHKFMTQNEAILSKLKIRNDNIEWTDNINNNMEQNKSQSFVDISIGKKLQDILNKFDKLSLDESNDKSKWDTPNEYMDIKYILSQINDQYRFNMLLSIHLLYENCKLSILLKSHLEPLVLLLSKISLQMGMYSYFDCYCRDFAHKIIPHLSKYSASKHLLSNQQSYNDKNVCPVPSIYEIIIQCMRGNKKPLNEFPLPSSTLLFDLSTVLSPNYNAKHKRKRNKQNEDDTNDPIKNSPFYTGSAIFSPLLGPYSLLRKVCYFYDILTGKADKSCVNTNKLFGLNCTPRNTSRYSLRNADNSNIYTTPLQINKTFLDNSYITPYTPTSIKKTRSRTRPNKIVSPSTPFTRHSSSRINPNKTKNKADSNRSNMSLDTSIYGNASVSLSTGLRQKHKPIGTHTTHRNHSRQYQVFEPYPFFSPSFLIKEETVYDAANNSEQLVLAMVEENFTLNDIDCLPLGIALPLREALRSCKYNPTHNWPKDAYFLIGREDLTNKGMDMEMKEEDMDIMLMKQEEQKQEEKKYESALGDSDDDLYNNDNASPLTSKTFMYKDKYKYEFGPNRHIYNKCYSGKRYQVKKILQNIGPPAPKLFAVNDINAIHKSSDNIRCATKTLKSLFMTQSIGGGMIKSTRQRLMNKIGDDINDISEFVDEELMSKPDFDGTLTVLDECLLQFGSDYRLKEVRRILRSNKARRIRDIIGNGRITGNNDQGRNINNIPEYHVNLFHQIKRRIAQCIGRGMFTIWSYCPTATKPIDIPLLNLSGIVPSRNLTLDIDFTIIQNAVNQYLTHNINNQNNNGNIPPRYLSSFDDVIFQEYEEVDNELFLQWVSFHNGCSAGLRVLSNYDESRENIRTWICYNKPKSPSYSHAGFIFAQGLNGHLTCLMPADFYWYLGHKHEPTTMSIILGLSIARRGTMDTYVHKICCLHIASMVPSGFAELGIETTVQASALLGIGFLFLGTKHKLSTDMLLVEMVRRSSSSSHIGSGGSSRHNNSNLYGNNSEDRECYSLCAGIALGLIHLGLGGQGLENRLEQLMGGNNNNKRCKMLHYLYDIFNARTCASSNYTGSSRPVSKYGINTGIPGGAGANSQATNTGLSVFATSNIINPSIAAHENGKNNNTNKNNNNDDELLNELISGKNHLRAAIHYFMPNFSDFPDINGSDLSYGGCNDDELNGNSRIRDGQWVNTDMTAPGAIFAYGLMYLKTNNKSAAKRLIIPNKPYLLDHIQAAWIYLKVVCKCIILWDHITYKQSYFSKQIPQFIQNNFPYKHLIKAYNCNPNANANANANPVDNNEYNEPNIDYHAITLAFINIISATCFAIGLKYAGTHNKNAHKIIYHYLLQFLNCRKNKINNCNVDRYTIETTLGVIGISLSLIMCGSGDLETFKIFRELRMCIDSEITYGHHQMYSMCVGFLFLGGGKLTLGNNKLAIASLLISCYPRFPINTLDNQFYLQILRHLYVLAIQKRHINTIDIDTNLPVSVPIKIQLLNQDIALWKHTPCLLPDYNTISSIKINCNEFWDIEFNNLQINRIAWKSIISNNGIIYLKRKCGYTAKGYDTQYQYNNIVNVLNNNNNNNKQPQINNILFDNNKKKQSDLVRAFGANPNILEFAKQFASPFTKMGKFCGYVLYECLSNAKSEMIESYIKLYHAISNNKSIESNNNFIAWDIKLLNTFYQNNNNNNNNNPLIQKQFVAALKNKFETLYRSVFEDNKSGQDLLLKYIKNGWNLYDNKNKPETLQILQTLGAFLSYSEMDTSLIINNALQSLNNTINISTKLNNNNNSNKLLLLPLLKIAIKSEIKKINSTFGYYGNSGFGFNPLNSKTNNVQNTPSMSSFVETPTFAQTPKQFIINNDNKINNNNLICLPQSFGLSVLANVLTK